LKNTPPLVILCMVIASLSTAQALLELPFFLCPQLVLLAYSGAFFQTHTNTQTNKHKGKPELHAAVARRFFALKAQAATTRGQTDRLHLLGGAAVTTAPASYGAWVIFFRVPARKYKPLELYRRSLVFNMLLAV
jgi:hypothetical protein